MVRHRFVSRPVPFQLSSLESPLGSFRKSSKLGHLDCGINCIAAHRSRFSLTSLVIAEEFVFEFVKERRSASCLCSWHSTLADCGNIVRCCLVSGFTKSCLFSNGFYFVNSSSFFFLIEELATPNSDFLSWLWSLRGTSWERLEHLSHFLALVVDQRDLLFRGCFTGVEGFRLFF